MKRRRHRAIGGIVSNGHLPACSTAVCNGKHTIRQRTAKHVPAAFARTGEREIAITQDPLAGIMGVGRPFVSRVLGGMRQQCVIESRRLRLIIKDEKKLRALS